MVPWARVGAPALGVISPPSTGSTYRALRRAFPQLNDLTSSFSAVQQLLCLACGILQAMPPPEGWLYPMHLEGSFSAMMRAISFVSFFGQAPLKRLARSVSSSDRVESSGPGSGVTMEQRFRVMTISPLCPKVCCWYLCGH